MMADKDDGEIDALAAMWAARLDRGVLSDLEKIFLDHWLAGDRRRLGALARAQASLVPFAELRPAPAEVSVADVGPPRVGRRRLLQMGAASATVAAGGALFALLPRQRQQVYRTGAGEVRMLPLADGSMVTLNTDSELAVDFSPQRRTLHLVHGEALFDVAKDPGRPFQVRAGLADVTAIGTSFLVRRTAETGVAQPVRVAVQTGVVEVAAPMGARQSRLLGANMQATAGEEGRIAARPLDSDELNRDLAWREGKIAFSSVSLREAVAEFNRYNRLKLAVDDESIAGRTMTGLFSATNPKGFATAVALSLEVDFYELPDRIVFTRQRPLPDEPALADRREIDIDNQSQLE